MKMEDQLKNNNTVKIVVDEKGYLRVKLPSGEMLPETELIINNSSGGSTNKCLVTVTFEAYHDLKNKD